MSTKAKIVELLPTKTARAVRVLAFMETSRVSGPAKNLIEFAQNAVNAQSCLQIHFSVATFRRGNLPSSDEFTASCAQAGIRVHVIRERFLFDTAIIRAMRRVVEECAPDIIQTHSVKSHFLMRFSGIYKRYCWIAFHHGYTWTSKRARLYSYLDRISLPSAARVVTVCRPFASALENIGVRGQRIVVQHNSIKPFAPATDDQILRLRRTLHIDRGTQVLVTVGRLSREKGHIDLIKALALLRRKRAGRRLRLVIVGEGPEGQNLKNTAKKLAVDDWVTFAGHQVDVNPYYSLANLMVLPSHTEGSPNCLLEALAAGLPVVATTVGGVPEIASPGRAAFLVEKGNPPALGDAIAHVLDDVALRTQLSIAARATAAAYSPESYSSAMLSLYENCVADKFDGETHPAGWRTSSSSQKGDRLPAD